MMTNSAIGYLVENWGATTGRELQETEWEEGRWKATTYGRL